MVVTEAGITKLVIPDPRNRFIPIVGNPLGSEIEVSDPVPLKTSSPSEVSELPLKVTEFKVAALLKAELPIEVTPVPTVTLVSKRLL